MVSEAGGDFRRGSSGDEGLKFQKRPVVIEAERITSPTVIHTLEGDMLGRPGDWLITGVNGERYPCKDEIFRKTYVPVEEVGGDVLADPADR